MSKIVVLSGAGISAESGISTFRDSDGLWENYDVKVICNYDSLDKHESATLKFYDLRRTALKDKEPNRAHKLLSQLKHKYPNDISIITQNIDNLFEKAGLLENEIIHLHGFLPEVSCRNCYSIFNIEYEKITAFNKSKCPKCDGKLRPNIVFFGEQAPQYEKLSQELEDCELFVVIGTSGNVIGVNHIANSVSKSILNNLEPSIAINEDLFSKVIYEKASVAIDEIVEIIEDYLK